MGCFLGCSIPFQITHAEIFPPFETEVNEGIGNKHTGCIKHVRAMFAVGNDEHVCSLAQCACSLFLSIDHAVMERRFIERRSKK